MRAASCHPDRSRSERDGVVEEPDVSRVRGKADSSRQKQGARNDNGEMENEAKKIEVDADYSRIIISPYIR